MEVNTDRCRRVYQDTAHDVIRFSKQQIVAGRWDRADNVRDVVAMWKQEARARDDEYVERARKIREEFSSREASEIATAKLQEERLFHARQQSQARRELQTVRHQVVESVREHNRDARDAVEESHLVPSEDVVQAVTGGQETLNKFTRFFDFRRMARATSEMSPRRSAVVRV